MSAGADGVDVIASAREQIVVAIAERYPSVVTLPRGTLSRLADEFGVTRETARAAAKTIGVTGSTVGTTSKLRRHRCEQCDDAFMAYPSKHRRFCSLRCATKMRRGRGVVAGAWAYTDEDHDCPICGVRFTWTAEQQQKRASNVSRGLLLTPEQPPTCSHSCAWRQGKRLARAIC